MFKLKRLTIHCYRNVKPGTELRFDDGFNLILGQNASGKTTLLALLSVVCRSTFDDIADEEFSLEYELRSERFTVTASVVHRRAEPSSVDHAFGAGPRWEDDWEIVLDDRVSGTQTTLVPSGKLAAEASATGQGATTASQGTIGRSVVASSVEPISEWSFVAEAMVKLDGGWVARGVELSRTFLNAYRFDESLDCFMAMTGHPTDLAGVAAPSPAHAAVTEHHDAPGKLVLDDVFVPQALAGTLHQLLTADAGRRALDFGGAERDLATQLAERLDVEAVAILANLQEHRVTSSGRSFRLQGFTFEVTRADGTTIHHDRLSYGQKRLLSFLYYLECNPHVVIADELVNGLHHRWIDACMEAMAGRQAFLTSQNPLLFDYVEFDSVEQVASSFVACKVELVDGREQLVWQNMSHQDATIFFEAYEVGIEHVGDILITRGLW